MIENQKIKSTLNVDLTEYCAEGARWSVQYVTVSKNVKLRVFSFIPKEANNLPTILFVAGWISLMRGWQQVLREMTKDFNVIYVETREKISSKIANTNDFSVEAIAKDLVKIVKIFHLETDKYIPFGSSLGGTAILESYRELDPKPLCFALLSPNAEYRIPWWGRLIVKFFWIRLYPAFKQFIKWYLKNFRLDIKSDQAQYDKYCEALDTADPHKLKPGALALAKYKIWDTLPDINLPVLIIGASKDLLHEPENLMNMHKMLPQSTWLDMQTNSAAHGSAMVVELRKYLNSLKLK